MALDYDIKEFPKAAFRPELMVGAVSPLWGFFGFTAMTGVAMWWMSRWARPDNMEAMFDKLASVTAAPALEAAEAVEAEVEALIEIAPEPELEPVGGEAAPISPLVAEAATETVEAVVEAAPEPVEAVTEAAPEPVVEAAEDVAPKARARKSVPDTEEA